MQACREARELGRVAAIVTAVHYLASDAGRTALAHLRESHSDHLVQLTEVHALIR